MALHINSPLKGKDNAGLKHKHQTLVAKDEVSLHPHRFSAIATRKAEKVHLFTGLAM